MGLYDFREVHLNLGYYRVILAGLLPTNQEISIDF